MSANELNAAIRGQPLGRRQFLRLGAAGAALACVALHLPSGLVHPPFGSGPAADAGDVIVAHGRDVAAGLRAALARAGGFPVLARRGEVVAIKPTLAWNRHPDFAANTSPAVLRAVVGLCLEAGAAEVRVFDRTSFRSQVCYQVSGATAALADFDQRRVRLLPLSDEDFVPVTPAGGLAPRWRVARHVIEADRLINLPAVKQHPARQVSLGLPNLLGAVGGLPAGPQWDGNAFIGEVASLLQPDLTILDASRVLTANGPMGRSREDVRQLDTLVLSTDPLAADIYGATLFGLQWRDVAYLRTAVSQRQAPIDPDQLRVVQL